MHELHHRANRVLDQNLANNVFAETLMPAIVFQEWGDPVPEDLTDELVAQEQGAAGGADQEHPNDRSPSTLRGKRASIAPAAAVGAWGADEGDSMLQKIHSEASSASSTGSGAQLTAEQQQKLKELQVRGKVV
ncbi:hypothetical protein DUNSADRAFT_6722 [Dunaliella salina]|uniref:Encoded protein n=1 Tax=Dunaliella salina TaxID=3046 RepID=A0ABQ7FTP2_DUNSA|nr:hypothetical protein DUNSADRAFT_6722 [Dunaliella salina]|eukprot:KAF5825815.1 hypothetical protein DUNSADRAFT_6722 [Dunaliella salina]